MTITKETAVDLILQKREELKKMMINEFKDGDVLIQVKNGRYGPYIAMGRKNFRIPKDVNPESLSLEDCKEIIEKQGNKPKRGAKKK